MYSSYDRLLSFLSVHHAIRAEKILTKAGIDVVFLPTPREIDISCGQCILLSAADQEQAVGILKERQAEWSRLFKRNSKDRIYEEIESR